jgi:hypothetical protein
MHWGPYINVFPHFENMEGMLSDLQAASQLVRLSGCVYPFRVQKKAEAYEITLLSVYATCVSFSVPSISFLRKVYDCFFLDIFVYVFYLLVTCLHHESRSRMPTASAHICPQ